MTPEEVEGLLGSESVPPPSLEAGTGEPSGTMPGTGAGVTEDDVASLFAEDDRQKDDTLRGLFDAALTRAPDRHAGVLELARRTKAPADVVEQNYEDFKTTAEAAAFDPAKFRTENPRLVELLLERPDTAPVVMRDEQISLLGKGVRAVGTFFKKWNEDAQTDRELADQVADGKLSIEQWREQQKARPAWTLKDFFPEPRQVATVDSPLAQAEGLERLKIPLAAYQRARQGAEVNSTYFKALTAKATGGDPWPYLKQATDMEGQLTPEFYNQSPLEQLAIDAAEGIASQVESIKGLGVGGLTLGAVGAVAGAATRNPGAAARLGAAGLRIGATVGTALTSFEQETGGAYGEFRKLTLDDGTPITDEAAVGMSVAAGAISAGIETLSLGPLAAAYKPLADALKAKGGREFLRSMLRDRTFRNFAVDLGKEWLKSGATEGAEEFLQTQTQNLFGYLAKVQAGVQYTGRVELPKGDVVGSLVEGAEAAQKGAIGGLAGFPVMASPAVIATGYGAIRRDRAVAAAGKVAAINDAAKTSATVKAAPDLVARLIEQETAETGEAVTHLYVDPGAFTRLFQENDADANQAAIEMLGEDGPVILAQAAATGEKVEVPLAEYLEKWANKPVAEALSSHTTTRSYHATAAELREQEQQTEAEARRIAQEYLAANEDEQEGGAESRLVDEIQRQLAEVGPGGAAAAGAAVSPIRQFIRTQAERFGVAADELFRDFSLRVQSQAQVEDATSFDFGAEAPEDTSTPAAEPAPASPELLAQARGLIARMKPENREAATAWLEYTQGQGERPKGTPRELVLKLAAFGVVDPEGFDYGAPAPRQKSAAQRAKKGKGGGVEPAEFKKARLMRSLSATEAAALRRGYFEQAADVPAASQVLTEAFLSQTHEQRLQTAYRDSTTGLLNARAFKLLPHDPARPLVAHISVEGVKFINDTQGHLAADALYRTVGGLLGATHPEAAKVGGDLAVHVADQAELEQLLERLNTAPELQGFEVAGQMGETLEEAREANTEAKSAAEKGGQRAERGKRPLRAAAELQPFAGAAAEVQLPAAVREAFGDLSPEAAFNQVYVEEATGLLTADGWAALPRKAHQASIDLNGLKFVNNEAGEVFGDLMLEEFGKLAARLGGDAFDLAHLHGDEYAAQSDDPAALEAFLAELADVGKTFTVRMQDDNTNEMLEYQGIAFGKGIGTTFEEADANLNLDKQRLTEAGERGPEVDARRFSARRGEGGVQGAEAPAALGERGGRGNLEQRAAPLQGRGRRQAFAGARGGPQPQRLEQAAFHGTPHRGIKRFSLQKIGTGEGAQAFGWGLYFAGHRQVAEHYRNKLAPEPKLLVGGREIEKPDVAEVFGPNKDALKTVARRITLDAKARAGLGHEFKAIEVFDKVNADLLNSLAMNSVLLDDWKKEGQSEARLASQERVVKSLEEQVRVMGDLLREGTLTLEMNPGQLYQVEVPNDDELLDYDVPLTEQPERVRTILERIVPELGIKPTEQYWKQSGGDFYVTASKLFPGGPKDLSEYLLSQGIPGLRYFDSSSRGRTDDGRETRNYVIWDEEEIDIRETFYQGDDIGPRGYVEMGQEGARRLFDIVLNTHADLSTFLHEAGHVFLEMMGDLAAREDAPAKVKEDWAKVLEYLGVDSREGIQREHHEKWARSFEAYLMEGKAPSAALARAFQRFKLWLKSVYRALGSLNVELTPEVRGVFDRLLATDEEIERGKQAMGLQPMFRSPAEAGMSPTEWQAYLDAQEKATARGARAAEHRILRDRLRETESWWKEEERALYEAALQEFDARPDARATRYIRKGELPLEDGRTVTEGQMGRMDRKKAYDLVGEARAKKAFGWRLLLNGGEDPDGIADLFGYATGREMLEAVIALPDRKAWATAAAAERMQQRHPDILRERGELEQLVAKGLHGDATSEWLLREWKALRSKASMPTPPVESIKQAAKHIVERRRVGRLEVGRTLQAERSAAQKAAVAAAKGDFAQAAVFKQQQLLNHYLYRELSEAKDFRDAFEELAAKQSKDKARARLGKASPKYRDGVDVMLEVLGLRAPERREVPPASLVEVVGELEQSGETVAFDTEVVGRILADPRPWKDLSVAELRQVYGYLRNLRQAAINRTTALVEGKRVDKELVLDELLADALKNLPKLGADASSLAARSLAQTGAAVFSGADGSLLKPEVMLDWLAGGNLDSAWHRAINLPLQRAKHREAELLGEVMRPIIQAFDRMPKAVRARFMEKVDGAKLFPSHRGDVPAPSRRFELLVLWMNSGNASNLSRLMEGRNIAAGELQEALDLLTKEEMDWCQQVLDSMEALWPLARDLEERDSGLVPEKIESTPITTRHGVYRGGYFPAVYDRRFTRTGEQQAGDALASILDPTFTRPGTRHNHLKARAKDFQDVIALDLSVVQAHLAQSVHDIAFREVLKSTGGLILSPDVQVVLKERLGDGRATVFLQWLKDIGSMRGAEVSSHAREWNRLWKAMRSNFVIGTLGWSAPVALGDLANFAVNATLIHKRHWSAGVLELMRDPAAAVAFALEKSGEMRFLDGETQREFDRTMKSITSKSILDKGPLGFLREHAFTFQEWTFKATATPLWIGAYRQGIAEGKSDAAAVTFADSIVRKGFPSHSAVDRAAILRDKGFWGNMTLFYGYFSQVYNLQRNTVHALHTAMGFKDTAITAAKVGGKLLALWSASSLLAELLSGRGPEDDEEWHEWALRKLLLAPLQSIPVPALAGGIESLLLGKRPSIRAAPGYAAVESLFKATHALVTGEDTDEKKVFALARALGLTFGVPTRPLRAAEYAVGAAQGQLPAEPADVASGLVYGPPRSP